MPHILVETDEKGAARVSLARPLRRNAFNDTMMDELTAAYRTLGKRADIRFITLSAQGPVFSAGADLDHMRAQADASHDSNREDAGRFAEMMLAVYTCPKPTIARVHGNAFAAGVGLIAACDIAIAASGAVFAITEAKLGLIPAVIGPYLVNAMGARAAKRLALTAETFTADQACALGLVHEVLALDHLDARVTEIEHLLLHNAPRAMSDIKSWFLGLRPGPIDVETGNASADALARARGSSEAREGVTAFLEKRRPVWPQ